MAKDVKAKVLTDAGNFILTIDFRPIREWFKEQFEKIQQNVGWKPLQKHVEDSSYNYQTIEDGNSFCPLWMSYPT